MTSRVEAEKSVHINKKNSQKGVFLFIGGETGI